MIERLGITPWLVERIEDPRHQDLITHPMSELLNTSLLMLAQGWRDQFEDGISGWSPMGLPIVGATRPRRCRSKSSTLAARQDAVVSYP